jgi:hypothetical protein
MTKDDLEAALPLRTRSVMFSAFAMTVSSSPSWDMVCTLWQWTVHHEHFWMMFCDVPRIEWIDMWMDVPRILMHRFLCWYCLIGHWLTDIVPRDAVQLQCDQSWMFTVLLASWPGILINIDQPICCEFLLSPLSEHRLYSSPCSVSIASSIIFKQYWPFRDMTWHLQKVICSLAGL